MSLTDFLASFLPILQKPPETRIMPEGAEIRYLNKPATHQDAIQLAHALEKFAISAAPLLPCDKETRFRISAHKSTANSVVLGFGVTVATYMGPTQTITLQKDPTWQVKETIIAHTLPNSIKDMVLFPETAYPLLTPLADITFKATRALGVSIVPKQFNSAHERLEAMR